MYIRLLKFVTKRLQSRKVVHTIKKAIFLVAIHIYSNTHDKQLFWEQANYGEMIVKGMTLLSNDNF